MIVLLEPPRFTQVRSVAGAITADSATINTTNYPISIAFDPGGRIDRIVAYWLAGGGTVGALDYIDLQVLLWDGIRTTPGWTEGATYVGIKQGVLVEICTYASSYVCLRVAATSVPAGTGLQVWAASAPSI